MQFGFLVLAASSALAAGPYPIKDDGVNCRSGPSTSYPSQRKYNSGDEVTLTCQTDGESISGDAIWGKTSDGCYVSDYYIDTGGSAVYVTSKCAVEHCADLNAAGVDLIKEFEGFVAAPEPDPVGLPTVGYGHLCQEENCAEVKLSFPLSKASAAELLKADIPSYTSCLAAALDSKVTLNENQWAALVSWTFNNGCDAAKTSTLVKRLNAGDQPETVAAAELPKWVYAVGHELPGLVRRRKAEIALFKTASEKQAFPKCTQ